MREFNLLQNYSSLKLRFVSKNLRTIKNRIIASYKGKEFYDGDRNNGYGGYKYDGRWTKVASDIFRIYKLNNKAKILQIGSDKGFLLNDIKLIKPFSTVRGVENSSYAISKTLPKVKKFIIKSDFTKLPFKNNYFDFVIAIGPIYTLNLSDAIKCLKEIKRVGMGKSFITLGSYDTIAEFNLFRYWTLLGCTILSKSEWVEVLKHCKYTGDYMFNTSKSLNLKIKK